MFSNKEWVDEAYCEDEIAADPNLEVQEISEGGTATRGRKGATPLRVLAGAGLRAVHARRTAPTGRRWRSRRAPPPAQTSANLTVGTPDANGAAAEVRRLVRLGVLVGEPGAPDDSDVLIAAASPTCAAAAARRATCGRRERGRRRATTPASWRRPRTCA